MLKMWIIKSKKIKKLHWLNSESKTSQTKTGFSLIEILTVLGILSIITITAIVIFGETRNRTVLQDAQATVLYALEEARSRATTGVGNTGHGVHIEEKRIVTFEGSEYIKGNGDEIILPFSVSTNQSDLDIIFSRISAQSNINTTIILSHISGLTGTITISQDGRILSYLD